jgi:ATP-binding cassette subfamily B protein
VHKTRPELSEKPSWSARFAAFKNVPPLLKMIWTTHRGYASTIIAIRVIQSLVPVASLWVAKLVIDAIVAAISAHKASHPVPWAHLFDLIGLEMVIVFSNQAIGNAAGILEYLLENLFSRQVSVRLMKHAATLDLHQFEDPEISDHLDRARSQTGAFDIAGVVIAMAQGLVTLLSLAMALVLYAPWLFVLLILSVLPSFIGGTHFATRNYVLLNRLKPQRRQLDYLRSTGSGAHTAKEIKLFNLSDWLIDRYETLSEVFHRINSEHTIRRNVVGWLLGLVSSLGYYSAYVWLIVLTVRGHQTPAGVFTLGVLTFVAGSFRQSRDCVQNILASITRLYERSLYLRDLFTFFDLRATIASLPGSRRLPLVIAQGFEFQNVGFRYRGSDKWAVRDLTFTLSPGERLALVGENGAGKTTLVKLLSRLYDPDEGTIYLDGIDLREYDIKSLHDSIGVIFQDFVRYDFTLKENIAVGEIDAIHDNERIEQAAQQSLASDVATRLKDGYDQMLGRRFENGVGLSGGEWQKIALARAYLRQASLLILDEPTAALDARAEFQLFKRFTELTKGKTAVLISHRFSTVRMADRILVMDQGRIIEQGTHSHLLGNRGRYAELFEMQAAGYK